MKRAADDAVHARPTEGVAVPHQPRGDADDLVAAVEADEPAAVQAGDDTAAEPAEPVGELQLTERELRILEFERQWWRRAGSKEQAIRDAFSVSTTRYYQLLNALLDHPAALAKDPVLVQRLRRLRATRTRSRRTSA